MDSKELISKGEQLSNFADRQRECLFRKNPPFF